MSLKIENSRRVAESRPVCMGLKTVKTPGYMLTKTECKVYISMRRDQFDKTLKQVKFRSLLVSKMLKITYIGK